MTFPGGGSALTHILVASDLGVSVAFYRDVLGASVYREYEGSCVFEFLDTWLLLVDAGGPTADNPDVDFTPPYDPERVSHAMTIRVADCQAAYDALAARGVEFITPPHDWGGEVRCFFRDPSGHLLEISEARS